MIRQNSNIIDDFSYKPQSSDEALIIRYCKQKCKQSNNSFFSRKDINGNVWHFGGNYVGDYYYAYFNNKLVRKKVENFFQDSFEEITDYSFIK